MDSKVRLTFNLTFPSGPRKKFHMILGYFESQGKWYMNTIFLRVQDVEILASKT